MNFAPTITKEAYEIALVEYLIDVHILRVYDGKLITSHNILEDTMIFETEDGLCKEWLNTVYDSYSFYEGFESFDDCLQYIVGSHYNNTTYVIIKFLNMYYAVVYENTKHQQIIGEDIAYYTKNNLFLVSHRPPVNLTMKDRVRQPVIPLIYHELFTFDPMIRAYRIPEGGTTNFEEIPVHDALSYIVLLGVTFKDIWFTCNTPYSITHNRAILNMYFNEGHGITLFGKYSNAIAINPFQRLIYLPKGRIEHFQTDIDDHRTPQRKLPYREVKRFHDNMRIRPINLLEEEKIVRR